MTSEQIGRLADNVTAGKPAALARAVTMVENARAGSDALLQRLRPVAGAAPVIGITGPPGAGKSTLIDALLTEFRRSGRSVAVLAVDPSSPISGGAILGDRTRMGGHSEDAGIFIRSLSARGHLGGLSEAIVDVIDVVGAAGWDVILIEAVGAGQSEVEIAAIADVTAVVLAPGLGDDIQAIKAGILEIADILVVNKADRDGADQTARQLRSMLELRSAERRDVDVLMATAVAGEGIGELIHAIDRRGGAGGETDSEARRARRLRMAVAGVAADMMRKAVTAGGGEIDRAVRQVLDGRSSVRAAARHLVSGSKLHDTC